MTWASRRHSKARPSSVADADAETDLSMYEKLAAPALVRHEL
jgi:hypothetical protein